MCTEEDTWYSGDSWAIKKKGGKKAIRILHVEPKEVEEGYEVELIGVGGASCLDDVQRYLHAGAAAVHLATAAMPGNSIYKAQNPSSAHRKVLQ